MLTDFENELVSSQNKSASADYEIWVITHWQEVLDNSGSEIVSIYESCSIHTLTPCSRKLEERERDPRNVD
jgi:galactose-1-phosphate uridylyltransferase